MLFPGEEISFSLVAKAIASFERTLVSYDSDFDRYLLGDAGAMSDSAKRGMELFGSKAGCIKCHNGPLLTDHKRHYTGVAERDGHGVPGTQYKTQSLRDSLRRYSYMHNGRMMSVRQVIEHYDKGGSAPEGFEAEIRPLGLTESEKDDLQAFLASLNGRVHRVPGDLLGRKPVESTQSSQSPDAADSGESGAAVDDPSYLNR